MTPLDPTHGGPYFIDHYEVVARLAAGGMADTWLCHDTRGPSDHLVVLKTLKMARVGDPQYHAMFNDEGNLGQILRHPNIARIEQRGQHLGVPYLVQEFIEGPSVEQLLRRQRQIHRFDLRLGVRIALDVAKALHHAHHATDPQGRPLGIIHRDVSPSNILVSIDGRAVLIDFGVAHFAGRQAQTEVGILKGKIRFMAPETIVNGTITPQTDLYGLGVVLHLLCLGAHAWAGEALRDRLAGQIPRPSLRRPDLPLDLEAILMRVLAPDPADRHPSARALALELSSWLDRHGGLSDAALAHTVVTLFPHGPEQGYSEPADHPLLTPPAPRSPWWALVVAGGLGAGALGLFLVAILVLAVVPADPIDPTPPPPAPFDAAGQHATIGRWLASAEVALDQGDAGLAAIHLNAVSDLGPIDPGQQRRHEQLRARLHIHARVQHIASLIAIAPGQALQQAIALDEEFPGEPAVADLIRRAGASDPP